MIKKTITYTDYNDQKQTESFYFHISKRELLDNMALRARLAAVQASLDGEERELTDEEVQTILDIIKDLIKLAYGIRSEDGKRFRKTEDIYQEFLESAAYDELLFGLFEDTESAVEFISGIIPKDLLEKVKEEQEQANRPQPQDHLKKVEAKSTQQTVSDPDISDERIRKLEEELKKARGEE